ncbi:hypothetical protein KC19_1G035100 [Ceratodon purpureus]|uniref:Uncharacterized protein n=1 Tax=Ceratodon purpureus TaxID=3225 RepID=A0A8T0J428_CERPU|nr:hypothetical protein KC19_1G035100 [Ceratodon purpureus]
MTSCSPRPAADARPELPRNRARRRIRAISRVPPLNFHAGRSSRHPAHPRIPNFRPNVPGRPNSSSPSHAPHPNCSPIASWRPPRVVDDDAEALLELLPPSPLRIRIRPTAPYSATIHCTIRYVPPAIPPHAPSFSRHPAQRSHAYLRKGTRRCNRIRSVSRQIVYGFGRLRVAAPKLALLSSLLCLASNWGCSASVRRPFFPPRPQRPYSAVPSAVVPNSTTTAPAMCMSIMGPCLLCSWINLLRTTVSP